MRLRPLIWSGAGLLIVAGIWYFWPAANHPAARKKIIMTPSVVSVHSASTAPKLFAAKTISTNLLKTAPGKTNQFANRLSNTPKTIGELERDRHAILLENAFLDTSRPLNLSIPKNLQSPGDPGAYIVQARGPIDAMFRALLAAAGARIVSYIPNDAYLVEISAGGAAGLTGNSLVAAVIPYEPYYKLSASLLAGALNGQSLPAGTMLKVQLYSDTPAAAIPQIVPPGGKIVSAEQTPIGWIVTLTPGQNWLAIPQSPLVENVEPVYKRGLANDLSRVTMGISTDTVTLTNYMNLYGSNVLVEVNDSGIDQTHPDFSVTGSAEAPGTVPPSRIFGDSALSLVDTNGHGTHVAGIIAGNGSMSLNPINVGAMASGSVSNADFRGKAPWADLYSVAFLDVNGNSYDIPDSYLQETPALTNALISNNSWTYVDDDAYDLAAASYDAAVRDALPGVTGSQPVLFVFAAGNDGDGDDDGGGGDPDTINSPATAKNVITVGALEQLRNITNSVTNLDGSVTMPWQPMTDTSYQIAGYSSRGNVGIGTEGTYGRFKPDVVAPGNFVVSDRSSEWDEQAYYNPTNFEYADSGSQTVTPGSPNYYSLSDLGLFVPDNAVNVTIQIVPNADSPSPFPTNLSIYVSTNNYPDPTDPTTYDFYTTTNEVSIPPDGGPDYLEDIINNLGGFNFAVVDNGNQSVSYDLTVQITTTNDLGNYYTVLSNLNDTLGPYYRYESGTSMSTPAVSGVLALMQDYFTNTLHATPSPALLKAMLINGARPVGYYNFQVQNSINYQGWGSANLTNSLPPGITNVPSVACSSFFLDQNPTNALATGDTHTFNVTVTNSAAQALPLRVTLAWTDPPGNPAAAIKLVNGLELVITNLDNPTNPVVYYGNDIGVNSTFNSSSVTNSPPNVDMINNVENVFLPPLLGTNYAIAVIGREVNVNAITAQTNNITGAYAPNIVQDFALVIACGEGEVTNAFTVADEGINSLPTSDQQITYVTSTNSPVLYQFVGASSPLLGTNTISYGTNAQITIGMTNQWHFYVVTNTGTAADVTNAAFLTFDAETLSIPRMGVFADSVTNATRPEADIDLFVSTNSALTNLDPMVISNAVANGMASVGRGGSEVVVDTNSHPNEIYYVGVQSEDQMASEYNFLSLFTATPFSLMQNGNEIVNGIPVPVNIPDGNPSVPGYTDVVAIATQPIQILRVIVTNVISQQNVGDLVASLTLSDGSPVVLMNHDSPNAPGTYTDIYDDSLNPVAGSQPSDGPGSLNSFIGQQLLGASVWRLHESDSAQSFDGSVQNFTLLIEPHQNFNGGFTITLQPGTWYYDYIDVPAGATNLTINATNMTTSPDLTYPLQLYVKYGSDPTATNYDEMVILTNGIPPGGSISIGPPLISGRYYVGIYNPSLSVATVYVQATLGLGTAPGQIIFSSSGSVPILDDAVTTNSIFVTQDKTISSVDVALRVDHPRVSDLVFHVISPDGTRVLLVENRGGDTTNGMGATLMVSNTVAQPQTSSGDGLASTNIINPGEASGTLTIQYNFYSIPDEMVIYDAGNNTIFDSGEVSGSGVFTVTYTNAPLTIVMNPSSNGGEGDLWDYTVDATGPEYEYLVLTENTNLTTTPIKFAIPPFVPNTVTSNTFTDSFEEAAAGDYTSGETFGNGWTVESNQVSVVTDPTNADDGSNFLALADGMISNTFPTVVGQTYTLTFAYRGPGIVSLWRGESNANDSISGNNGSVSNDLGYATGEVNSAFNMGTNGFVFVPAAPSLDVGSGSGFTIDGWIYPTNILESAPNPIIEWNLAADYKIGLGVYVSSPFFNNPGCLSANFQNSNQTVNPYFTSSPNLVTPNVFQHVALTFNHETGNTALYLNGAIVASTNVGNMVPYTSMNVLIGRRINIGTPSQNFHFAGKEDEISVYDRTLSDSEIQAIYQKGSAGKFDATAPSIVQGLAEAQISLNGGSPTTFSGNNTNWQTQSVTFTATQSETPVEITGVEPGMLLYNFTLTQQAGDLYYLPEQSLDTYAGENADGTWQLEIQDDRAGATNPAPALLSWQLRFNFTTTTSSVGTLTNGMPQTNTIPANSIAYYLINVPVNAEFATNWLFTTNGPLNLIFNSTTPPGGTNGPGDYLLFTTSTNDSVVLGTNSPPPNIVPGGSYYLGVQNTNSFAVNYGIEVDFDLLPVTITNSTPVTNNIPTNSITEIIVAVPTNAIYASNILISATGPINVYFNQTNPATGDTNAGDFLMLSATNDGSFLLNSASAPPLVPGADYYIGLQNLGTNPVSAVFQVIFGFATPPTTNSATNLISISSIVYTNMDGTNGFLLTWFAPSNDLFQVQWTTNLAPVNWNTFTNIISYNPNVAVNPTNTQFNFFDDGSQDGGFGPMRFYRLLLLSATNTLILPSQTNYTANVGIPLTITNTAADSNTNLILTYSLTTSPTTSTPATIDTNGIVTWTPGSGDSGGAFQFTTVVTDSGLPPLSATNNFTVFVLPAPAISSAIVTTTNVTLQWTAPTNDLFQVEWTTNLVPAVNWTPFSTVIASTNGDFTFTDTNAPLAMKFYRLLWLP